MSEHAKKLREWPIKIVPGRTKNVTIAVDDIAQHRLDCNAAAEYIDLLEAENAELVGVLGEIKWRSVEKDNMEFRAKITCYQMNKIRAVLAKHKMRSVVNPIPETRCRGVSNGNL